MDQIEIQGPQVPLLVEAVMGRLQETMERNAELERALSDVPRLPTVDRTRIESLEAQCIQAEQKYLEAHESAVQLKEKLEKADQERQSALKSARVLRGKCQNASAELTDLRKQLIEERELRKRLSERESAVAKEVTSKERKQLEEAQRALEEAKAQLAVMESQQSSPSPSDVAWSSVARQLDIAVTQFDDDPDKSLTALKRAQLALEARHDDGQAK